MLRGGDAVIASKLPPGLDVYWGYPDGRWRDYLAVAAAHPGAFLFSTVITAADDGDELDIEAGDATDAQAPGWVRRQQKRGLALPKLYRSVSGLDGLVAELAAAGISRGEVRIRSAHYSPTLGAHVCAPGCYPGLTNRADSTQWVDHGGWDESMVTPAYVARAPGALADPSLSKRGKDHEVLIIRQSNGAAILIVGEQPIGIPDGADLQALQGAGVGVAQVSDQFYAEVNSALSRPHTA